MSKIGLVLEGGGMKCAYTAGILDAMMDNGVTFDYCIGVSAGSANGVLPDQSAVHPQSK